MKAFLVFFDEAREGCLIHKIKDICDITIDTGEMDFRRGIKGFFRRPPTDYILTVRLPHINAKGNSNIAFESIARKRESIVMEPYGVLPGKWLESKQEFNDREKNEILRIVRR